MKQLSIVLHASLWILILPIFQAKPCEYEHMYKRVPVECACEDGIHEVEVTLFRPDSYKAPDDALKFNPVAHMVRGIWNVVQKKETYKCSPDGLERYHACRKEGKYCEAISPWDTETPITRGRLLTLEEKERKYCTPLDLPQTSEIDCWLDKKNGYMFCNVLCRRVPPDSDKVGKKPYRRIKFRCYFYDQSEDIKKYTWYPQPRIFRCYKEPEQKCSLRLQSLGQIACADFGNRYPLCDINCTGNRTHPRVWGRKIECDRPIEKSKLPYCVKWIA